MISLPKPPEPADPPEEPNLEAARVVAWRLKYLIRAGYDEEAALLIAESTADLHRAAELLTKGCDVHTALRILL